MPSPAATILQRSSSHPDLKIATLKAEALRRRHSGSARSSASSSRARARARARAPKLSYWTTYMNKLGDYINPTRSKMSNDCSNSKHSDLTEEGLDAHNNLHGMLSHKEQIRNYILSNVDEKNKYCSPYYTGLIDLTLSINRERKMSGAEPESPGPEAESATTTFVSSAPSSSFSSFLFKLQEYGSSCFASRKKGNKDYSLAAAQEPVKATSSSTMLLCAKATSPIEKPEKKLTHDLQLVDKEKPLRERVSQPSSPSPSPSPSPTRILLKKTVDEMTEPNIQMEYQKFVLADKYRPKALKDFICNRSEATRLQDLVKQGGSGHVIFDGPPGVGKRTMIWAMLREAFGPDTVQCREERKAYNLKGESIGRIEVNVKESSKHVEVNLSDLRGYEKHVIMELMKDTQTQTAKTNKALLSYRDNCRAIIPCEADKLSTDALLHIKWLLERYKGCNKVFFCCTDVSKLQPIRPHCTLIKLNPPSQEEIVEVLEFIAKQEGIFLPHKLAEKMAKSTKNNLRQAIRSFEACWHSSYPFEEDQVILTGWEEDVVNIAKNIVEE